MDPTQFELSSNSDEPMVENTTDPTPSEPEIPKSAEDTSVADPVAAVDPQVTSEPEFFTLPDGRKLTGKEFEKEYKENFLPEFTRKSQELADLKRNGEITKPIEDIPEWQKPDYIPESYADVIKIAKEEALKELKLGNAKQEEHIKNVQTQVETEISELKKIDPTLDENALFAHATKYNFQDLKTAHSNMSDFKKSMLDTEERVLSNIKTRETTKVAVPAVTISGTNLNDFDPTVSSRFSTSSEYLDFLKGKK